VASRWILFFSYQDDAQSNKHQMYYYGIRIKRLWNITKLLGQDNFCSERSLYSTNYSISIISHGTYNFVSLNSVGNIFPMRLQYPQSGTHSTQNIPWMQVHKPLRGSAGTSVVKEFFPRDWNDWNTCLCPEILTNPSRHLSVTNKPNQSHLLLPFQLYRDWCRRPAKLPYQISCDYSLK